jgi:hypothetical protein
MVNINLYSALLDGIQQILIIIKISFQVLNFFRFKKNHIFYLTLNNEQSKQNTYLIVYLHFKVLKVCKSGFN